MGGVARTHRYQDDEVEMMDVLTAKVPILRTCQIINLGVVMKASTVAEAVGHWLTSP